jgi:hypothetical protein
LLSGRAAAHLYRLVKGSAPRPEVLAPTERRVEGVRTIRSRRLDPRDATRLRGIPVTTVPRTLVDLASLLNSKDLARGRRPPGVADLRAILHGDIHVTLSALEQTFLEPLTAERLPLPITNKVTDGRRVDCRWPTTT